MKTNYIIIPKIDERTQWWKSDQSYILRVINSGGDESRTETLPSLQFKDGFNLIIFHEEGDDATREDKTKSVKWLFDSLKDSETMFFIHFGGKDLNTFKSQDAIYESFIDRFNGYINLDTIQQYKGCCFPYTGNNASKTCKDAIPWSNTIWDIQEKIAPDSKGILSINDLENMLKQAWYSAKDHWIIKQCIAAFNPTLFTIFIELQDFLAAGKPEATPVTVKDVLTEYFGYDESDIDYLKKILQEQTLQGDATDEKQNVVPTSEILDKTPEEFLEIIRVSSKNLTTKLNIDNPLE